MARPLHRGRGPAPRRQDSRTPLVLRPRRLSVHVPSTRRKLPGRQTRATPAPGPRPHRRSDDQQQRRRARPSAPDGVARLRSRCQQAHTDTPAGTPVRACGIAASRAATDGVHRLAYSTIRSACTAARCWRAPMGKRRRERQVVVTRSKRRPPRPSARAPRRKRCAATFAAKGADTRPPAACTRCWTAQRHRLRRGGCGVQVRAFSAATSRPRRPRVTSPSHVRSDDHHPARQRRNGGAGRERERNGQRERAQSTGTPRAVPPTARAVASDTSCCQRAAARLRFRRRCRAIP